MATRVRIRKPVPTKTHIQQRLYLVPMCGGGRSKNNNYVMVKMDVVREDVANKNNLDNYCKMCMFVMYDGDNRKRAYNSIITPRRRSTHVN